MSGNTLSTRGPELTRLGTRPGKRAGQPQQSARPDYALASVPQPARSVAGQPLVGPVRSGLLRAPFLSGVAILPTAGSRPRRLAR